MKFLIDEHIALPIIRSLRAHNIDIISLQEIHLLGSPDRGILNFANREKRAVVTRDKDFTVLHSQGNTHQGIIFLTQPLTIGDLIRELFTIDLLYRQEDLENRILYIPLKH